MRQLSVAMTVVGVLAGVSAYMVVGVPTGTVGSSLAYVSGDDGLDGNDTSRISSVALTTTSATNRRPSGPGPQVVDPWPLETTTPSTAIQSPPQSQPQPQPSQTAGPSLGPVTTRTATTGQAVGYIGVLGGLGPHDEVAAKAAEPPPTQPGVMPLTGLAGSVPNRPAAVVKIDNSRRARPQTGLNLADIVVEEEVEGGITRLAAIFHSQSTVVGPVRSGRTTDIGVIVSLGTPMLMYSGANTATDALLLKQVGVQNRSAARSSGYWRASGRRAPSNLFTDTSPHWASASGGPPPAQFAYRDPGAAIGGTPSSRFSLNYRSNPVGWEWDTDRWLRSQGGKPHTESSGQQVSAANVVVIETERVNTGMVDSSGAVVPEFPYVGTGRATIFTAGHKIQATWTRPTLASVATLTDHEGQPIKLTPGRTWLEIIETGLLG